MMRLMGAVLVAAGGAALGFQAAASLRKRGRAVRQMEEGLALLEREDFSSLWRRLVQERTELTQEGQAVLLPLGETLGRYDGERQREALSAARRRLGELAARLEADCRRQGRVYQALGLSGGAFLVILLL